jgi:hypothetical protein
MLKPWEIVRAQEVNLMAMGRDALRSGAEVRAHLRLLGDLYATARARLAHVGRRLRRVPSTNFLPAAHHVRASRSCIPPLPVLPLFLFLFLSLSRVRVCVCACVCAYVLACCDKVRTPAGLLALSSPL